MVAWYNRQNVIWLLLIIVAFIALIYKLDGTILPKTVLDAARKISSGRKTLNFSLEVNGSRASPDNMYISRPEYKINAEPNYYVDKGKKDLIYQLTTYYVAGELARRYNARYMIDIGCGSAVKLSSFRNEFHVIGIDYETNIQNARKEFPSFQFIEANLEGDSKCDVDISPEILSQAVIVSADIMEHLKDPLSCYVKILKNFSKYAAALVVSTPDSAKIAKGKKVLGPPGNQAHVREWLNAELEVLFLDKGLYPVYSGLSCGRMDSCGSGFLLNDTKETNQIHILGNEQVRSSWLTGEYADVDVVAFIIHDKGTTSEMLNFNVKYLTEQGIKVNVINIGSSISHDEINVEVHSAENRRKAFDIINSLYEGNRYKMGDWFLVLDSYDVINFHQSDALPLTLKETLLRIGSEPYGFNAVAMTTLFMQDGHGKSWTPDIPFKIFSHGVWNVGDAKNDRLWPGVDTLKDRVRIWKKSTQDVGFKLSKAESGAQVISDVTFIGRRVYPYHALDLRFHPQSKKPYSELAYDLRRMYVLDIALNYQAEGREPILLDHYLY